MCGITGLLNFGRPEAVDRELLRRMNDRLVHRGPDDSGLHLEGPVGLAMRRLSIIDLSGGHQPISNEDDTVWVTMNGEIYNFPELRDELQAKGHRFKTRTDTETIVHLYEEHGTDCVKRLRGMFAFALWDRKRSRLLLARDRIGKKPLVYAIREGRLAWASELQGLMECPWLPRDILPEALDLYLSLQYIPSPLTIYRAARKLPPGHLMVVEGGSERVERYWDLPSDSPPSELDFEEAKEAVREKLREATRIRMISDVPLGAFLSGGIDSSVVVSLMAGLSERPVKTFSIGFKEEAFSELGYARQVAERYGTEHTEFLVEPHMTEVLPLLARHYGEPYADASALPSYYVARETRRHVTVALNGDGGDENFGGYLRYVAMRLARRMDLLPRPARRALSGALSVFKEKQAPGGLVWRAKRFMKAMEPDDELERYFHTLCYFTEAEKQAAFTEEFRRTLARREDPALAYLRAAAREVGGADDMNRWLRLDFRTYLPECLMAKIDIATMAVSLEGRSPFLDHEFVELVAGFPGAWKVKGLKERGTKHLLKEAFSKDLPPKIKGRGKMGFGIPLGDWFRGELKGYWEERVLSPEALRRGYFDAKALRTLWDQHQARRRDHGYKLWALLMLELWHRECHDAS